MSDINILPFEQEKSDYLSTSEMLSCMHQFGITGNITSPTWYKIIKWKFSDKTPNGKPHREAIELLSEIFYWYRPTEVKDQKGNVKIFKKFESDILQKSYKDIEESMGMTQNEARSAFKTLESLGIAEREFRDITVKGVPLSNVLFIRFHPNRLKELMNEYFKESLGVVCSNEGGGQFESNTYTETNKDREKDSLKNNNSSGKGTLTNDEIKDLQEKERIAIKAMQTIPDDEVPHSVIARHVLTNKIEVSNTAIRDFVLTTNRKRTNSFIAILDLKFKQSREYHLTKSKCAGYYEPENKHKDERGKKI